MSDETVNSDGAATAAVGVSSSEQGPANADVSAAGLAKEEAPVKEAQETQPQQSELPKRHLRKTRVGQVLSNKMDKTIVIAVVRRVPHAKFGKIVKRTKKLYAHDGQNQCAIGDLVRVEETRPLSRLKRWQLVEVLKH